MVYNTHEFISWGIDMPRTSRKKSNTGYYHIISRGNEKKSVFDTEEDKKQYLHVLKKKVDGLAFNLYAYCIMNNHVHILLEERDETLEQIFRSVNTSYAMYYNKANDRVGHVFQDRFISERVEAETYLLNVVRYIHNNPVKAGIVKAPEFYKWSSYKGYCEYSRKSLICRENILGIFSSDMDKAVEIFKQFHQETDTQVFLEVLDEWEEDKNEKAKHIIHEFCLNNNITIEALYHKSHKEKMLSLIYKIAEDTELSGRRIAELTGINRGLVQRILKDYKCC